MRHQRRSAAELLVDCTTPSTKTEQHPCNDRGLAQQGAALAIIDASRLRTNLAIAECERIVPPLADKALETCVLGKLKATP